MSYGVEARLPFCHPDIYALRLDMSNKLFIKGFANKFIMRKLIEEKFPDLIPTRKKIGFIYRRNSNLIANILLIDARRWKP